MKGIDLAAVSGLGCRHDGHNGGDSGPVALVFGGEDNGLSRDELMLCSHACVLPTASVMPSLNLSHAVAAVLSRVFYDAHAAAAAAVDSDSIAGASGSCFVEGVAAADQTLGRAWKQNDAGDADGGVRDSAGERGLDLFMWSLQRAFAPSLSMAQLGGLLQPLRAILNRAAPNTRELRVLHAFARHIEALQQKQ